MSSHTRKNLRTSTTIFEYPERPPRLYQFLDGCLWGMIVTALILAAGAIGWLAFQMW